LTTSEGVAAFLGDLRGQRSISDIARASGESRFYIGRWLKGVTEPKLPDLLKMIDVLSLRLLDFIATLTDPGQLDSTATAWQRLQSARSTAYDAPWSHAVLRALEIEDYRRLQRHIPGWIAKRVGLTRDQEEHALRLLKDAGQISKRRGRWVVSEATTVDTRHDPAGAQKLREFWTQEAVERLKARTSGVFSYNLFSVSRADLQRIAELQRSYFRDLRAIVAESEPAEAVALVTLCLCELDAESGQ
jgi:hypothetical protein